MNHPVEITFQASKLPANPFADISLDVVFTDPLDQTIKVPAFWAGKNQWKVRYSSRVPGKHRYRTAGLGAEFTDLDELKGETERDPYEGDNPLYTHGPLRVSADKRHFEHSDGTPFLWLADTWSKNLCSRISWEEFRALV